MDEALIGRTLRHIYFRDLARRPHPAADQRGVRCQRSRPSPTCQAEMPPWLPPRDIESTETEPPPPAPADRPSCPGGAALGRGRRRHGASCAPTKRRGRKRPPEATTEIEAPKAVEIHRRPGTTLQTIPRPEAEGEVERAIRLTMTRATNDLNRIDHRQPNADARTRHDDTAKSLIKQAGYSRSRRRTSSSPRASPTSVAALSPHSPAAIARDSAGSARCAWFCTAVHSCQHLATALKDRHNMRCLPSL